MRDLGGLKKEKKVCQKRKKWTKNKKGIILLVVVIYPNVILQVDQQSNTGREYSTCVGLPVK